MAKVKPRKSWATWFLQRALVRRWQGKPIDPVILQMAMNVARYQARRSKPIPYDILPRIPDMRTAVDVVREPAPVIEDAKPLGGD